MERKNPTEEELIFWADVFETHRRIVTQAKKQKTEKQLRKWLADPYSDAAEYKLWGNGVALPCVYFCSRRHCMVRRSGRIKMARYITR